LILNTGLALCGSLDEYRSHLICIRNKIPARFFSSLLRLAGLNNACKPATDRSARVPRRPKRRQRRGLHAAFEHDNFATAAWHMTVKSVSPHLLSGTVLAPTPPSVKSPGNFVKYLFYQKPFHP
jgi:hypothetical protein